MICKHILKRAWSLFLHTVKWFQELLYKSHHFISVIFCTCCSGWPIDTTLSGATTPSQSRPRSNSKDRVLCILQFFTAGDSPSDCLMSYSGHLFGWVGSYPSAEMQLVYSTAPADWAVKIRSMTKIKRRTDWKKLNKRTKKVKTTERNNNQRMNKNERIKKEN